VVAQPTIDAARKPAAPVPPPVPPPGPLPGTPSNPPSPCSTVRRPRLVQRMTRSDARKQHDPPVQAKRRQSRARGANHPPRPPRRSRTPRPRRRPQRRRRRHHRRPNTCISVKNRKDISQTVRHAPLKWNSNAATSTSTTPPHSSAYQAATGESCSPSTNGATCWRDAQP